MFRLSVNKCLWPQALVARTTLLFSNFLFTNLFSIKFLYFFIISSLFPYFNLFVSIFIQSYVNIMCRPYIDTNNPQGMQLGRFKNRTWSLLASSTFIAPYFHYVIQTRTCIHLLPNFRIRTHGWQKWRTTALTSTIESEKFQKFKYYFRQPWVLIRKIWQYMCENLKILENWAIVCTKQKQGQKDASFRNGYMS